MTAVCWERMRPSIQDDHDRLLRPSQRDEHPFTQTALDEISILNAEAERV